MCGLVLVGAAASTVGSVTSAPTAARREAATNQLILVEIIESKAGDSVTIV